MLNKFSYLLIVLMMLIAISLFALFGGVMYYFGYEEGIEKSGIEIAKEKDKLRTVLDDRLCEMKNTKN